MGRYTSTNELLEKLMGLQREDPYTQMLRVAKCAEECGEAVEAVIAYHNVNPRKPAGPLSRVLDELGDVALTALLAIESFGEDAEAVLHARHVRVHVRLEWTAHHGPDPGEPSIAPHPPLV